MPQFCINLDGTIIQFIDVCEKANHGESQSDASIGIEFVNHPFGINGNVQDGKDHNGIFPTNIPLIKGYPSLKGLGKETSLYIPNTVQLEALVTLVSTLLRTNPLAVEPNWWNVININPKKLATETLDDLHAYFILDNAGVLLKDKKYKDINKNQSDYGWTLSSPGVFCHSLFGAHADGLIQSFYTWLRINQHETPEDAQSIMIEYLSDKSLRNSSAEPITLVDIHKLVFVEA